MKRKVALTTNEDGAAPDRPKSSSTLALWPPEPKGIDRPGAGQPARTVEKANKLSAASIFLAGALPIFGLGIGLAPVPSNNFMIIAQDRPKDFAVYCFILLTVLIIEICSYFLLLRRPLRGARSFGLGIVVGVLIFIIVVLWWNIPHPKLSARFERPTAWQNVISHRRLGLFGADVNTIDSNGYSVIQLATRQASLELIDELIKRRADVNSPACGREQIFGPSMARWHAGNVEIGKTPLWTHRFTLRNNSSDTVTITQLKGSCDCTSGKVFIAGSPMELPLTVAPHMDISVEVDIATKKLAAGPLDKMLWVYIAGRNWPADTLEIVGTLAASGRKPARGASGGSLVNRAFPG